MFLTMLLTMLVKVLPDGLPPDGLPPDGLPPDGLHMGKRGNQKMYKKLYVAKKLEVTVFNGAPQHGKHNGQKHISLLQTTTIHVRSCCTMCYIICCTVLQQHKYGHTNHDIILHAS